MKSIQKSGKDKQKSTASKLLLYILPFGIAVIVMLFLFWKEGYCPFGNNSLATMDANIQYLDFFAYLKDVFAGENSISYTFGKTLGGTNIAVFSYYLSSPFNLLLVFFDKSNLVLFFDCIVVLKLATAATTMAYFLTHRFRDHLNACFVLLLSVSYALMQYNIAQCSNIMWLDGVYMLPLMLLGIYKAVNGERPHLLIFSTGLSIIFNWYSAGINCIFTAIWFCLEWLLALPTHIDSPKQVVWDTIKKIGVYVLSLLIGVLLSACLFLPTLISLSSGGRGQIDLSIIKNTFNANIMNTIQGFTLGARSSNGQVSLYCGSLALLGCIAFFASKKIDFVKKVKVGVVLAGCVMIFYWQPLFVLFSLLKNASSYWYRYSYVTIFLIIFIAADFYSDKQLETKREPASFYFKISVIYSIVLLMLSYLNSIWKLKEVYYSCIFMIVIAVLVTFYYTIGENVRWRSVAAILLVSVLTIELAYNTKWLMNSYHKSNESKYQTYSLNQQAQIDEIKTFDSDVYRISQTTTYNTSSSTRLTANYNEALAYNYWSISGYTSDPDDMQRTFLDKLGYRINGANMCIVNTSILAADSLLGVKYVLSDIEVNGLELVDSLQEYNGKSVYYNPYALSMAFVYDDISVENETEDDSVNSFEYQNQLYSQLLGENVELYFPLDVEKSDSTDSQNTYIYTIDLLDGNYAIYGNISWKSYMNATLNVNDSYKTSYSKWLSPSVFYIPTDSDDSVATVTLAYKKDTITDEQFYALDLDLLAEVTQKISSREADTISIQNGYAEFQVTGVDGERLYISIPYNEGWTITLNGREVEPEMFADCMISIPLESGANTIVMNYHVPYLKLGIGISLITMLGIGAEELIRRKRQCA